MMAAITFASGPLPQQTEKLGRGFKCGDKVLDIMELVNPPNFGPQPARFGPRCDSCEHYDEGGNRCRKYSVPVRVYTACDSWKRNSNLPITAV
jgi:hypothetical protein